MGIGADSSVATWAGSLILIGSAIASAAYANQYCRAFEGNPRTPKSQNHVYYTAQYVRVLGALTAGFAFLYAAWIFVDSRHPAKTKLWSISAERLQKSRLQAKRSHMRKLAAVEGVLAVTWIPPAFILAFKGWLYERHFANGTKAQAICSPQAVQNCNALLGVGVATIITMVVVVLLFVITLIPCTVKPAVKAKTPEELAKEEEEKKKKEAEEDRAAGNRIRRAFGLPELSEAQYAEMRAAGNNGSQECWGFRNFPEGHYGAYYSGGWGYGGSHGGSGGAWAGWGGGTGHWARGGGAGAGWTAGAGSPIVPGAGGGSPWGCRANNGQPTNFIDVNIPLKQVFSRSPRYPQRRRHRNARRYYQLIPASVISGSTSSSNSRTTRASARTSGRPPSATRRPAGRG